MLNEQPQRQLHKPANQAVAHLNVAALSGGPMAQASLFKDSSAASCCRVMPIFFRHSSDTHSYSRRTEAKIINKKARRP